MNITEKSYTLEEVTMDGKFKAFGVLFAVFLLILPVVGCAQELNVWFWEPRNGHTVTESQITVECKVTDVKAEVTVNGIPASVTKEGIASVEVTLTEGENTFEVVATRGKQVVTKTMVITYSPSE